MRKRIYGALLALGMGGALVAFSPLSAEAACPGSSCTATLSATLNGSQIGSRVITTVTPGAFSSVLGNAAMSSTLGVLMTETAVSGDPNYQVNGSVSDFTDGASHTIVGTALQNSANSTAVVAGSGAVTEGANPSGPGNNLGVGQTFFSSSGESATSLYTGTYTNSSTLTLTPPNNTYAAVAGTTYTATLTVTLIS